MNREDSSDFSFKRAKVEIRRERFVGSPFQKNVTNGFSCEGLGLSEKVRLGKMFRVRSRCQNMICRNRVTVQRSVIAWPYSTENQVRTESVLYLGPTSLPATQIPCISKMSCDP